MRKGNESGKSNNARGITRMSDDQRLGLTMIIISLKNTMKTTETIIADVFVIPNPAFCYNGSMAQEEAFSSDFVSDLRKVWWNTTTEEYRKEHEFKNEVWIQVWYITPGQSDSNWCNHKIDGYKDLSGWYPISEYLPKSLFKDHKEGDCITIDLPIRKYLGTKDCKELGISCDICHLEATIKVQLQLSQMKYRYRRFGNFEDALARV